MAKCLGCNDEIVGHPRTCCGECAFWSGVRPEDRENKDACWPWQKHVVGKTGYARMRHQELERNAHRVSWAIAHDSPDFPMLFNKCGYRACVNPAHWTTDKTLRANRRKPKEPNATQI